MTLVNTVITEDSITIEPSLSVTASVIWLHGLGADGHDFEPVIETLSIPNTRFILPHAPHRPITMNGGYEMRGWYDIIGLDANSPQDEAGIVATQQQIEVLIAQEMSRGIPANKIALAGFSQGGAIALHTALRYPQTLAGVLALSTYLPLQGLLASQKQTANQSIPILMTHGTYDNVITLERALLSRTALEAENYAVEWHEYPMAHSLCMEEIEDIRDFLNRILV